MLRCRMFHPLTVMAMAGVCALFPLRALTQTSFSEHTVYTASGPMSIIAHGDFNNDGREDVIVTENQASANYLLLSNGDGTYDAPIKLSSPAGGNYIVGDFNHDGNLDYAVLDMSSRSVDLYEGHGDGTFTGGTALTTDYQPVAIVAADLNHDNCTDIVVLSAPGQNTTYMQTWLSQCTSTISFSAGQHITSGLLLEPSYLFAGDFDGDGKADVAVFNNTTLQVWYGDGKGNLGSPIQVSDPSTAAATGPSVGDADSNGTSDVLVAQGSSLGIFKGNANRTVTYQALPVPSGDCVMYPQTADLNGDGLNDVVYEQGSCAGGGSSQLVANLATGKGVYSTSQDTIRSNPYWTTGFGILKSTRGTKPDIAVFPSTAASQTGSFPPDEFVLMENTTSGSFPGCGTTAQAEGINVCMPNGTSASSPVTFSVSATGPTPMRTVAVWADGQKLSEQLTHAFSNYSFLEQSLSLSAGSHNITIYGTGWDNSLQQKSFTLTVGSSGGGGSCGAPSSAGVHVCSPVNGSTVNSPVQVSAAATITGTLARMEVWVDGTKMYSETTSTSFSTSLALTNGYHRFDIYAVNTAGTKWESTVYATVGTASSCAAPSSAGVHVCSPVNGSTVSSPVQATATATITGTLARMELWVDGVKKYTETTSTSMTTSVALGTGKHQFDFYAVNTAGTKWETTVFATVQ